MFLTFYTLAITLCCFASANTQEPAASEQPTVPRLSEIKKVFVDKMPNDLDKYMTAEMIKKFKGQIQPVMTVEEADAILTGSGEHQKGTGAAITGRFFGLHDTATAAVVLLDKTGKTILWADEAGDRSLFWGVFMRGGPRKVASRVMKHLDAAIREDGKKGTK